MRRLASITIPCLLLLAACTSPETVVVSAGSDGGDQIASDGSVGDIPTTIEEGTTTTVPDEVFDPVDYLLTEDDVPGWKYVPKLNFPAEPTFDVVDCDPMVAAWSAHATSGTRVRASTDGVSLRHTVVEMPDVASAKAVIEGADAVWRQCNPLMLESGTWWTEPIQVPEVEGWRSSGLALGVSDNYIWSIAWFQQGTTVVFLDLDSDNPWPLLDPVLEAAAGRLGGDPSPVLSADPPRQSTTTSSAPTNKPGERPTSTTNPTNPDDEWRNHSAATHVPDAAIFGSGFSVDRIRVEDPAPSDPDDAIGSCPVDPPPTMDGLRIDVVHESDTVEVELLIGVGNEGWAQDTVDSFRALGLCGPEAAQVDKLIVIEPETGADDAVILDVTFADEAGSTQGLILVARYGDMTVLLLFGVDAGGPVDLPTVDQMTQWADEIAA